MNAIQQDYINNPNKFKQILWDYTLSPEDFLAILNRKQKSGWLTQDWAITRVLEHTSYYDAIALVPLKTIQSRWQYVKPKLFNKELQKGYEYVLHKYTLSTTR